MPWPDVDEFATFLTASGLIGLTPSAVEDLLDLQGALDAGVERWNDLTYYWPFMSTGVVETRYFDPAWSYLLDLNSGLLSLTSLETGLQYLSTGSLQSGTSQINVQDFKLKPMDAPNRGKPYTYIEASWWGGGGIDSRIGVTGVWGYCLSANLPSSARRAVMALAAQDLMGNIELLRRTGGLKKLTRGDETKEWSESSTLVSFWGGIVGLALKQGFVRTRISWASSGAR